MKRRYILTFFLSAAVFLALLFFFSELTEPKYVAASCEGNLIAEYYRETDRGNRHDVIFIGDCEAYSAFVPPILYKEYGIRSFVRGSPSQSMAQSYYLVRETLKYEKPRAVVLSVYALCKTGKNREAYNRMTLDGMRMSWAKIGAVRESAGESESSLSYLFPLLCFHSRIYSLEAEDFEYLLSRPRVSHNGYFMQSEIVPAEDSAGESGTAVNTATEDSAVENTVGESGAAEPLPEDNLATLKAIANLCRESGVELILVKAPISSWRYPWQDSWDSEIESFAAENGLEYYNLIKYSEEIGIDLSHDTYDGGIHLNVYGAEKTSRFFGKLLVTHHGINGGESEIWERKLTEYYKERNNEEN